MREEAVSCRRKSTCETHVSAMSSSGLRTLQQSKTCECLCDGGPASYEHRTQEVHPGEYRSPLIGSPSPTENGITVASQRKKIRNINEQLHRTVRPHEDTNMNVSGDAACSCPSTTVTVNSDSPASGEQDRCAVIRLSLRKPRHWKWKLTTCASSPTVILLDEGGDLLLNTGKRSGPHVDRNGNHTGVQSADDPSTLTQRNGTEHHTVCAEHTGDDHLSHGKGTDGHVKGFEQDQEDETMRNLLLRVGQRSMTPNRSGPGEAVETTVAGGKNQRPQSHDTSPRSVSTQKESQGRLSRTKVHRRMLERRRNCADCSSSSDSSPELHRKTRLRDRATGDRLLAVNGFSYEEASRLLKRGPDVLRLNFYRRRSSGSNQKGRHDTSSGSQASSRRSKCRNQRQNASSLYVDSGMGSNVSRHSEKGLSGRRTQSSGNLCNGNKILAPTVGRILVPCSGGVGPKDRNKFCGSLPNHLDSKHCDLSDACCNGNNNNGEHTVPQNKRSEVELDLHPLPAPCTLDPTALHDQGYGSERSPEEEQPPSLPGMLELTSKYPFITQEATFEVCLLKGSRGLGLSVTGGVDSGEQWPGLVRIKRLFQQQPAWQTGQLAQGDVLLAANGVHLIGLTNYQALEVLRKTPNSVLLTVCRPASDVFCIQGPSEPPPPPPPPRRDPAHSITCSSHYTLSLPAPQTEGPSGEFDIMLTKVNRSLGFTLRREDESVLGHYVRALVREPALSDGRIRPGDKIVAVNDTDISPMSHEEAVMFLRQCGDQVKLRLYRDAAQTPVSALSPTEEVKSFKPKPLLRKEAMDMLSDLAVKKQSPCDSSSSSYSKLRRVSDGQCSSPCMSPRRRRLTKTPSPDVHAVTLDRLGQKYVVTSHVGNSDSSGEQSQTSTFTYPSVDSTKLKGDASSFASAAGSGDSIDMKPQRPNFLDLCGDSATPCTSRKKNFMFSVTATRDDEWDSVAVNSESDELATNTTLGSVSQCCPTTSSSSEDFRSDCVGSSDLNYDRSLPTEPASMPPLTNLSSTSSTSTAFSYRNPAYQSAHPGCYVSNNQSTARKSSDDASDQDIPGRLFNCQPGSGGDGSRGLLKWKGIVFTPENDEVEELGSSNLTTFTDDSSSQLTVDRENEKGAQVFMVELTRGWNSRLGFSLRGDGHHTYISAIYADSVAAKDGRLQAGDQVLMVNDENVDDMSTAEVIDLLRKIRGTIGITVLRKTAPNLQVS